ncbi:hypothetical protein JY97_04190 [Alkalispirochaeta odontotermitis]|nr:hypothetical protein JY97_04190 [Alkalispirochaeta odontotermitis]CAB1075312.1 hypothetical protein D1AOALGA4SA_3132 [Olavius algarvensis Delta 1 endosymbiont]
MNICGSPSADLFYSAATVKTKIRLIDTQPVKAGVIKIQKLNSISILVNARLSMLYKDAIKCFAHFAQN